MNGSRLPRMIARIIVVAIALAVPIARFIAIDTGSHSASDTLRPWLIETAVVELVAGLALLAIDHFGRDRRRVG